MTGGAGYIGSLTFVEFINARTDVTVSDNFCNSNHLAFARVAQITGKKPMLVQGDMRSSAELGADLHINVVTAVIHFAGLKSVRELVQKPMAYYDNNMAGSLGLQARRT